MRGRRAMTTVRRRSRREAPAIFESSADVKGNTKPLCIKKYSASTRSSAHENAPPPSEVARLAKSSRSRTAAVQKSDNVAAMASRGCHLTQVLRSFVGAHQAVLAASMGGREVDLFFDDLVDAHLESEEPLTVADQWSQLTTEDKCSIVPQLVARGFCGRRYGLNVAAPISVYFKYEWSDADRQQLDGPADDPVRYQMRRRRRASRSGTRSSARRGPRPTRGNRAAS